jgi:nucleotide sugar dehydrogenase|tara:strand:+ start:2827 stop:3690 length:864 start_codon:yes stop_codon:yes gene_type:complete
VKISKRIGIIGNGFVGSAVRYGFSPNVGIDAEVRVYDKDPNKSTHPLRDVLDTDIIFLSVPTPSNSDGSMNIDIVDNVLQNINEYAQLFQIGIILLRSTVTPGTTRKLQEKYKDLRIVFNPEFLTERSANFDFINQSRFILGGNSDNVVEVSELFRERFGSTLSIIETNYETAEMIKYMTNTFFATKISFLNDMKLLSDKCGVIWEDAIEGFVRDGRVGHSHLDVPGHDGKYGFGGSCFPKDIQALINFGESNGVDMNVLKGAWETNLKVRPEKDWERLKGRAVVDE